MSQQIFLNIPVADLERSKALYQAIGFSLDLSMADETACCVVISEHIHLMILSHPRFDGFATLPRADTTKCTAAMFALSQPDRAAVDAITDAAMPQAGRNQNLLTTLGCMYTRTYGNVFEPFWMDTASVPKHSG